MLILGWEDVLHGVGPLDDDRPDLLSVHRLCSGSSAVAYQSRDLFDGDASVVQRPCSRRQFVMSCRIANWPSCL
jgi:hypothetical protein